MPPEAVATRPTDDLAAVVDAVSLGRVAAGPRSTMALAGASPTTASGVQRKARDQDATLLERPTTCPRSLMPLARLSVPPGRKPSTTRKSSVSTAAVVSHVTATFHVVSLLELPATMPASLIALAFAL